MIKRFSPTPDEILRYRLAPTPDVQRTLDELMAAYQQMFALLEDLQPGKAGANLVALHDLAYETIRNRTGLPARLVTLGLRDFASRGQGMTPPDQIPLDEKLFAIKGPTTLTIATIPGRVTIAFDTIGYAPGWSSIFPACLTVVNGQYEIHIGVTRNMPQTEESVMSEGILSRMGRLIAGLANATVDKAEGINKVAVIEQAIREIDTAADDAKADLGKARAEEYRIGKRRAEIGNDIKQLEEKIRMAMMSDREDLAKAGVARQIDLEAQITALDKAMADANANADEAHKALQAILATRREAETRLIEFKQSLLRHPEQAGASAASRQPAVKAERAAAAVSRMTGVTSGKPASDAELDELDRLHREKAIAERLARIKEGLQ